MISKIAFSFASGIITLLLFGGCSSISDGPCNVYMGDNAVQRGGLCGWYTGEEIVIGGVCPKCGEGLECSTLGFICQDIGDPGTWTDSSTGLMWQNRLASWIEDTSGATDDGDVLTSTIVAGDVYLMRDEDFFGEDAARYCNNLDLGGHLGDWRVPTISELRTLVRNCPPLSPGGSCGVTDTCFSDSCANDNCEPSLECPVVDHAMVENAYIAPQVTTYHTNNMLILLEGGNSLRSSTPSNYGSWSLNEGSIKAVSGNCLLCVRGTLGESGSGTGGVGGTGGTGASGGSGGVVTPSIDCGEYSSPDCEVGVFSIEAGGSCTRAGCQFDLGACVTHGEDFSSYQTCECRCY